MKAKLLILSHFPHNVHSYRTFLVHLLKQPDNLVASIIFKQIQQTIWDELKYLPNYAAIFCNIFDADAQYRIVFVLVPNMATDNLTFPH
jgi:hypothetical protein